MIEIMNGVLKNKEEKIMKKIMKSMWAMLQCLLGNHETFSFSSTKETMILPVVGDNMNAIMRKFNENCKLRCRYCSYTYPK